MDTTGLFYEAAQRWSLSDEVAEWPAAEIAESHGPGRQRGPVDENGVFACALACECRVPSSFDIFMQN